MHDQINVNRMSFSAFIFLGERPRSPAPDRWRDECRERSDQALDVPAGRCSVDRMGILFIIVISKLGDLNSIPFDSVNHAMLRSDSTRPESRKCVLERLWLAYPFVVTPACIFDQFVNLSDNLLICLLPMKVFLPGLR